LASIRITHDSRQLSGRIVSEKDGTSFDEAVIGQGQIGQAFQDRTGLPAGPMSLG
jgi:hypothetical protein